MPPPAQTRPRPARALLALSAIAAALAVVLAASLAGSALAPARAASAGQLQQRISSGRARVSSLRGQVASARRHVAQLDASISTVSGQLARIQSELDAERAQLASLRRQLAAARTRLTQLEATEARDEQVLAQELVGAYEQGSPDLVTVVMQATGFNELLDQLSFEQRIQRQDARIVAAVTAARSAVAAEAITLGSLSLRQQRLTDQIQLQENSVSQIRLGLVRRRLAAARVEAARQGVLSSAQARVASLHHQLVVLEAAQAAAQPGSGAGSSGLGSAGPGSAGPGSAAAGPSGAGSGPAPAAPSSGGFELPMPKADVSPPSTWSPDQGVDISAPGGTPELAVCSGTIVLHGIGGFGPSAPVLHCDSPIDGYSYVYYGHAGPGNWVPIGTHVSQGQVISEVGYGIVGISSGPHLEIGFADSSGSPIGPQTAGTMLSLLQAAYNG